MTDATENNGRTTAPVTNRGRFAPGNPGRPKGSLNKTSIRVEELLSGEAEEVTRVVVAKALRGDLIAAKLILDRVAPPRRDTPVQVPDLPALMSVADVAAAHGAIVRHMAAGNLSPSEAEVIGRVLDSAGRALTMSEIETRVEALERIVEGQPK
jgi:hypothetical protein